MFGKLVSLIALVAVAAAASRTYEQYKPFEGVDPNSLSCDPTGEKFLLLPHYSNCSQFYMCVHGQEVEFDCAPGGLVFDFELQTCNWASASPCILRDEEGSGSGDEGEFTLFPEESELQNAPVGEQLTAAASGTVRPVAAVSAQHYSNAVALNCNNAVSAARQLPYKGDCQRFWKCVEGVPQTFYCSDGLFFNEATQQCDHEDNVRCSVQVEDELNGEYLVYK